MFSEKPGDFDSDMESLTRILRQAATDAARAAKIDPNDPHRHRFGAKSNRDGFVVHADVSPISSDLFQITLTVSREDGSPIEGEVEFHLLPTFTPSVRRVRPERGVAKLSLEGWGAFTVGVVILDTFTELEIDLSHLSTAPEEFRVR